MDRYLSTTGIVKRTGISLRQLYYWEKIGIIKPKLENFGIRLYRRYRKKDAKIIEKILDYLDEGYTLKTAAEKTKSQVLEDKKYK